MYAVHSVSVQIELYDADLYSKGIHALVNCAV